MAQDIREYNPLSDTDLSRLRRSMEWSRTKIEPFVKKHVDALREYVGHNYGQGGSQDKVPINFMELAVGIYTRSLVGNNPRYNATTAHPSMRAESYELSLAMNHLAEEIDLRSTFQEVVRAGLFGWGIVKLGITPSELGEHPGYLHDAGQPFADPVLLEDFVCDMTAKRREQWDYVGNEYELPIDLVMENPMFDDVAKRHVERIARGGYNEGTGVSRTETSSSFSQGNAVTREKFVETVRLVDLWLPFNNLMVTMLAESDAPPLRVVDWEGPERGPIHVLSFNPVPGNVLPLPPAQLWIDLHDLANRLFLQLGRQAERQKTFTVVSGGAASDGTGERIMDVQDGQVIRSDYAEGVKEVRFGGVDNNLMGFVMGLRPLFSYFAGNLDVLGGLGAQADTLGQEQIIHGSSSARLDSMRDDVFNLASEVGEDLGFYLYTDPEIHLPLVKKSVSGRFETEFVWGPERREADFYEYNIKIEHFSLAPRTPSQKLQQLMQLLAQVIMPALPYMQQQGTDFQWSKFFEVVARYGDFPEMAEMITSAGSYLDLGQPVGERNPNGQGNGTRPLQSPVTSRTTVRRDVGQGQQGGPGAELGQMVAQMMNNGGGDGSA